MGGRAGSASHFSPSGGGPARPVIAGRRSQRPLGQRSSTFMKAEYRPVRRRGCEPEARRTLVATDVTRRWPVARAAQGCMRLLQCSSVVASGSR
jgi:hypothetical protein